MPKSKLIVNSSLFIVILTFASLLTVSGYLSTVHSVTPLEQARNDYSFQLSNYSQSRERYLTAQANYLSFKTAVAKNEAFAKTKDYFLQVHNVYTAYLLLIEERTNVFDWSFSSYKKDDYIAQIRTEDSYVKNSQAKAEKVQTLEEIVPLTAELKLHLEKTTIPVTSRVLATSDLAQIEDTYYLFRVTGENIDNFVKDKITDANRPLYLNWSTEISGIKSKLDTQINISRQTLAQTNFSSSSNAVNSPIYNQTQESRAQLERAKSLLAEILDFI